MDLGLVEAHHGGELLPGEALFFPEFGQPVAAAYRASITAYLRGGDLDRPLSIYRDDHSEDRNAMRIQPIANWKGDFVTGAFFDGTAADCMASAQPSCIDIQWPGERVWHGWENKDPELVQDGPRHWMGSLVYGSADASGLLYRRNRYYDPVAGQFTQEDPIGIAGGLNLYGFANGDPVNFSDPFGLCPDGDGDLEPDGGFVCALGDLAAGFGDAVTFGLTAKARDLIGAGDQVDESSGLFTAGQLGGLATATALGAGTAQAIRSGGTLLTSVGSRFVGQRLLTSRVGQAVFGPGRFSTGPAVRVGVSRGKNGRMVFRAAGELGPVNTM